MHLGARPTLAHACASSVIPHPHTQESTVIHGERLTHGDVGGDDCIGDAKARVHKHSVVRRHASEHAPTTT
jgi:hypothetical protein